MKIAYIFSWELSKECGVTKKIRDQISSWKKHGHIVEVFCFSKDLVSEYGKCYRKGKFSFESGPKLCLVNLYKFQPDIVYLRHEFYKPYLTKILRSYPTIVEINSNDINEYRELKPIKDRFRYYYHLLTRSILLKDCRAMITVSNEVAGNSIITKFGKEIINIPNAIDCQRINIIKKTNNFDTISVFMLTTGAADWVGIDKFYKLANRLKDFCTFHIIGLNDTNFVSDNVTLYGYLSQAEYHKIISQFHIAVGTLAFHRIGLVDNSPLKTRESIATGFPMILPYKDTAFLAETPDWILEIPNNEEWVDNDAVIEKIKDFCIKYKDKIVTHEESRKYIDSEYFESKRLDFFKTIIDGN